MGDGLVSVRDAIRSEFTLTEILTAEIALTRFSRGIKNEIHANLLVQHLLREARTASEAIARKHRDLTVNAAGGPTPGDKRGSLRYGTGAGLGFYQEFERGAIYWRQDLGACWVYGAIYVRYLSRGGEAGLLGYPTSDERSLSDREGRYSEFEHGSIYWHRETGAFELHGPIHEKWKSLGWQAYGYPAIDVRDTPGADGQYSEFLRLYPDGRRDELRIYWTPSHGGCAIYGAILTRWIELGLENSYIGFPINDEMDWHDDVTQQRGRISRFEHGGIGWFAEGNRIVELPEQIVIGSGQIGTGAVSGWVDLIMTSLGTFHYRGHLHDSGFVGYIVTVMSLIKIPGTDSAFAAKKEVNVGGTISFDGRDEDFDDWGYSADVRAHWKAIRNGCVMHTTIHIDWAGAEFLGFVFLPAVLATTALVLIFGGDAPERQRCKAYGPHSVKDGNNNTILEYDTRCDLSQ